MAPARKRAKAAPTNPNTVLVVFLVFFVLLSIGLGLFTYYGYQKAQQNEKKGTELANKSKKDEDALQWYKFQALWSKYAAGHPLVKDNNINEENDLANLIAEAGGNKFTDPTVAPNKAAVDTMVKEDQKEKALGWDDKAKKFKSSYRAEFAKLVKERDQLLDDKVALDKKFKDLKARQDKYESDASDNWKKLKDDINNINKNATDAITRADRVTKEANDSKVRTLEESATQVKKLQDDYDKLVKDNAKLVKDKDDRIAKMLERHAAMESEHKQAIRDRENEIAKLTGKKLVVEDPGKINLLNYDSPKGKVVWMDWSGTKPYINLGTAQGAKEQLTFSVYGVSTTGKVDKTPKGSIEIVRVINANLSQARITYMSDLSANPMRTGDQVFNPAWNPKGKTHVAIAGIVNFTGEEFSTIVDQMRALRAFMNFLERRQNIVVDAYLDLRDLKQIGKMSIKTDYFILGDGPSYASGVLNLKGDKDDNYKVKTNQAMAAMRDEAKKNDITILTVQKFGLVTGFRMPKFETSGSSLLEDAEKDKDKDKKLGEDENKDKDKDKEKDKEKKDKNGKKDE